MASNALKEVCACCRVDAEMGVRGLTTFIDSHPELLTDFQLHDTRIVIDGNNLYHFLYYYFHVPCEYGGDYYQFARCCDTFFATLHSCNVTPYVIFDGAHAADGNKFQTSLARARERVHMSNIVAHGRRAKILPILTHSCFVRVLQRLGVEYVTCDFEADRQIAALARHWNCPVLTNDSDFFIYNIPAGVVLLDYLNLRCRSQRLHPKQNSEVVCHYLEAQIFYCQKFMKFLHVHNHSLVVLFATLLGNDIVDGRNFENFFSHVKLPKPHSRSKAGHRESRIAGLTGWLQSVSSVGDAVAYILAKLPQNSRKSVESLIELSLEFYTEPWSELHRYFDMEQDRKKCVVKIVGDSDLPDWFQVGVWRGTVPTAVLNVLASRRLLLQSQIEPSSEVSSYRCSHKLRQIAYGIALSVNHSGPDCSSHCAAVCVSEFDRESKTMKMCSVEPVAQLNDKRLPCLSEVAEIDRRHRFLLLLEALDTCADCVFDLLIPDVQFLVAILRYWLRHATAKISSLHIHALLLCFLKLGALDAYLLVAPQSKSVSEAVQHTSWMKKSQQFVISDLTVTKDEDSSLLIYMLQSLAAGLDIIIADEQADAVAQQNDLRQREIDKVKERLVQFDSTPHHNHAVTYNAAVVYTFAEFQTCFMSATCIASLLGLVVHDPANVFSGTVLYNLTRELQCRSNPDMYVTELLAGTRSMLSGCYFHLMNAVLSDVPEGRLEVTGCRSKKKAKKSKKNGSEAPTDVCEESDSLLQDGQSVDADVEHYVVNCDTDNRFSNLSLTEE